MPGPIRSLLGLVREGAQRRVIRATSLRSSIGHVDRPYLLFEAGVDFNSFIYIVSHFGYSDPRHRYLAARVVSRTKSRD